MTLQELNDSINHLNKRLFEVSNQIMILNFKEFHSDLSLKVLNDYKTEYNALYAIHQHMHEIKMKKGQLK